MDVRRRHFGKIIFPESPSAKVSAEDTRKLIKEVDRSTPFHETDIPLDETKDKGGWNIREFPRPYGRQHFSRMS